MADCKVQQGRLRLIPSVSAKSSRAFVTYIEIRDVQNLIPQGADRARVEVLLDVIAGEGSVERPTLTVRLGEEGQMDVVSATGLSELIAMREAGVSSAHPVAVDIVLEGGGSVPRGNLLGWMNPHASRSQSPPVRLRRSIGLDGLGVENVRSTAARTGVGNTIDAEGNTVISLEAQKADLGEPPGGDGSSLYGDSGSHDPNSPTATASEFVKLWGRRISFVKFVSPDMRGGFSRLVSVREFFEGLSDSSLQRERLSRVGGTQEFAVDEDIRKWAARGLATQQLIKDKWIVYRKRLSERKLTARPGDFGVLAVRDTVAGVPEGSITRPEFLERISAAIRRSKEGYVDDIPEIMEAASSVRTLMRTYADSIQGLKDGGVDFLPDTLGQGGRATPEEYLSRLWDHPYLLTREGKAKFVTVIQRWILAGETKTDDAVLALAEANEIHAHIVGSPGGRTHLGAIPVRVAGALRERVIDIPDELVRDFIENDITKIIDHYTHTVAPSLEITRWATSDKVRKWWRTGMSEKRMREKPGLDRAAAEKLVDKDAEKVFEKPLELEGMRQIIFDEAEFRATQAERQGLKREAQAYSTEGKKRWEDLHDLALVLQGQYRATPDFSQAANNIRDIGTIGRGVAFLGFGGRMLFTQFYDMQTILIHNGVRPLVKGLILPMVRDWKAFQIGLDEARWMGIGLEMMQSTRTRMIADIDAAAGQTFGRGVRFVNAAAEIEAKATGLALWNVAWKRAIATSTVQEIAERVAKVVAGTLDAKGLRVLNDLGIDIEGGMASRIHKQITTRGTKTSKGYILAQSRNWLDDDAREIFELAIQRRADRSIPTPSSGSTPLIASSQGVEGTAFRTMFQFRRFGMMATQRVLVLSLQKRDAGVLLSMIVGLQMGMLRTYLLALTAGTVDDLPEDEAWWLWEALQRMDQSGILPDMMELASNVSGGDLHVSNIPGIEGIRPPWVHGWEQLAGPAGQMASDAAIGTRALFRKAVFDEDLSRRQERAVRHWFPMTNLFYTRVLFDKVLHNSPSERRKRKQSGKRRKRAFNIN